MNFKNECSLVTSIFYPMRLRHSAEFNTPAVKHQYMYCSSPGMTHMSIIIHSRTTAVPQHFAAMLWNEWFLAHMIHNHLKDAALAYFLKKFTASCHIHKQIFNILTLLG